MNAQLSGLLPFICEKTISGLKAKHTLKPFPVTRQTRRWLVRCKQSVLGRQALASCHRPGKRLHVTHQSDMKTGPQAWSFHTVHPFYGTAQGKVWIQPGGKVYTLNTIETTSFSTWKPKRR